MVEMCKNCNCIDSTILSHDNMKVAVLYSVISITQIKALVQCTPYHKNVKISYEINTKETSETRCELTYDFSVYKKKYVNINLK